MPDASFGWTAAKWAWENRGVVAGPVRELWGWFRASGGKILIIGPGGVGKSTLAHLLSGNFDWLLDEPWRYDQNYGIQEFALGEGPNAQVVVLPGQVNRREATWPGVEKALAAGAYRGVILVAANGYHAFPNQGYRSHRLYTGNKKQFLTAYLQTCREDEVTILTRVAASALAAPGKMWLLTVVTKEDLWWPSRGQAAAQYTTGRYAETVAALAATKGEQAFRHEVVPASLVIGSFVSGEGELLHKNAAGYGHQHQVASVRRLFEAIGSLREWEAS